MQMMALENDYNGNDDQALNAYRPHLLILDDAPIICKVFKAHLSTTFPNAEITIEYEPKVRPGHDVYFIDNDFNGEECAVKLVMEIQEISPQSLIVCSSSKLTPETILRLRIRGCDLFYDKIHPQNSEEARKEIFNHLDSLKNQWMV